jgi:hypothetical protein
MYNRVIKNLKLGSRLDGFEDVVEFLLSDQEKKGG